MSNLYKIVAHRPKNNREIDVTYSVYRGDSVIPINENRGLVSTLITAFGELAAKDLFESGNSIGVHEVRV